MTIDAVTTATAGTTDTTSHSHTVGSGADRLLLVGVGAEDSVNAAIQVQSVTYNGISLTQVVELRVGSTTLANAELWELREADMPAGGTYTVVVTMGSNITAIMTTAASYTGIKDQAPEVIASSNNSSSSTSHSTNITTLTNNAMVVDCFAGGTGNSVSADAGQTERSSVLQGSAASGLSDEIQPTAGVTALIWGYSSQNRVTHVLAAYEVAGGAPAVSAPTGNIRGCLYGPMGGVV